MKTISKTLLLVLLLALIIAGGKLATNGEIGRVQAIGIAMAERERFAALPHTSNKEPINVSAELENVPIDEDMEEVRVWTVRMELGHGSEEGVYVEATTGEILGGFSGSP